MVGRNGGAHRRPRRTNDPTPTKTTDTDTPPTTKLTEVAMADMETALKELMTIDGAIGVALVDYNSGMALGVLGGSKDLDLTVAAAGNTDVVRAKMRTIEMLNLKDGIEDILITLNNQYHLIRPLTGRSGKGLFLYLAVLRSRANLALARHQLSRIEEELDV